MSFAEAVRPSLSTRAAQHVAELLGIDPQHVHVAVGTQKEYRNSATTDDLGNHQLAITITDPRVADNFAAMEKEVLQKLSTVEALKATVQFESDAANVVHRREQLEAFRAAGAAIPENFKNWNGFNPDNADRWGAIPKHALNGISRSEAGGISFSIQIPEGESAPKDGAAIKANLDARKGEIMALLQKRAVKYLTRGLDDTQKAAKAEQIAQQFANMTMEVTYNEPLLGEDFRAPGSISVVIASKQQRESAVTFKDKVMSEADKLALAETNPLTAANPNKGVSGEAFAVNGADLGKALGRAVLFEGDMGKTPSSIFPLVAGKEDMKTAITKQLVAFKATHPDRAKEVDEFLNDEAFKGSDWNKPKRLQAEHKSAPDVIKDPTDPAKANVMTVSFSMKAEKAQAALEGLAAGRQSEAVLSAGEVAQSLAATTTALAKLIETLSPKGYAKSEETRSTVTNINLGF